MPAGRGFLFGGHVVEPMMKALITGASGFSASHLMARLKEDSIRVVGLDRRERNRSFPPDEEYRQIDITDFDTLSLTIGEVRPDYVFHLAGVAGGSFQDVYRTNALGTITLLESVRVSGVDARVLLVGSAAEYGRNAQSELPVTEETPCDPVAAYGLSKYFATLAGQNYVRRYGMKIVVARVFNLIGAGIPQSLVVGALLARAKAALRSPAPPVVKVGNLRSQRDFVAVTDAVDAYLRMVRGEYWGEIFNLCSGRAWSIGEVADKLLAHSPRRIELEVDPALARSAEVDAICGCNDKARRLLGFEVRTRLEDALKSAWDHHIGEDGP